VLGFHNRDQMFYGSALSPCQRRIVNGALSDRLLFGDPGGEALAAAVGGQIWSDLAAKEWLEATPLMRALHRRSRPTNT
jgi:hypothetical protein